MKHLSDKALPPLAPELKLLRTPQPPYYVVITTKVRKPIEDKDYENSMANLEQRVKSFDGYLGMECVEELQSDGTIHGISAIYWKSLDALDVWRKDEVHMCTKVKGKSLWYQEHNVRVCQVLTQYGSNLTQGYSSELAFQE